MSEELGGASTDDDLRPFLWHMNKNNRQIKESLKNARDIISGAEYILSAHSGYKRNNKRYERNTEIIDQNKKNMTSKKIEVSFLKRYFPYWIKDYIVPDLKDIPFNQERPEWRSLTRAVDQQRKFDQYAGAKIAGKEIYLNLTEWLKNENGVHAETLLAMLGSIGGRECVNGVISVLRSLVVNDSPDRAIEYSLAGALDILICDTENGEQFVLGGRIANLFGIFYENAASETGTAAKNLLGLSEEIAGKAGTDDYWITPFDEYVKNSPKGLADLLDGKFETTFSLYCRFPLERMLSYSVAAQKAVKQAEAVMTKERALSILAEYGWRTSHYLTADVRNVK